MLRLTLERRRRGISQTRLAAMTGIAPQDISALENGWKRPYPGWKKRIARALGVDGDALFEEVDDASLEAAR